MKKTLLVSTLFVGALSGLTLLAEGTTMTPVAEPTAAAPAKAPAKTHKKHRMVKKNAAAKPAETAPAAAPVSK